MAIPATAALPYTFHTWTFQLADVNASASCLDSLTISGVDPYKKRSTSFTCADLILLDSTSRSSRDKNRGAIFASSFTRSSRSCSAARFASAARCSAVAARSFASAISASLTSRRRIARVAERSPIHNSPTTPIVITIPPTTGNDGACLFLKASIISGAYSTMRPAATMNVQNSSQRDRRSTARSSEAFLFWGGSLRDMRFRRRRTSLLVVYGFLRLFLWIIFRLS